MRPTPVKPEHKIPAEGTCEPTRKPCGRGNPAWRNRPGSQPHGYPRGGRRLPTGQDVAQAPTGLGPGSPQRPSRVRSRQLPGVAAKAGRSHTQDRPPPGRPQPGPCLRASTLAHLGVVLLCPPLRLAASAKLQRSPHKHVTPGARLVPGFSLAVPKRGPGCRLSGRSPQPGMAAVNAPPGTRGHSRPIDLDVTQHGRFLPQSC